ncbi:MAG: homoserine dehydrogenase [Fibrobacterales bacterium]
MSIRIGIIGLGTVGSGTYEILSSKRDSFIKNLGVDLEVTLVCAREDAILSGFAAKGIATTKDALELVNNENVDIVIELAGGYDLPKEWILTALKNKKHVVTANKALIAKYGAELFPVAEANGVALMFEAAIGGGIPIIKAMQESLVGNEYQSLNCIINGTCNYIMTEMTQKGSEYKKTLKIAQELGYAEADPTFDVEGIDSAHKTAILASICSKTFVDFEKMHISGISTIEPVDIDIAKEMGYCIKLLGTVCQTEAGVDARVHPCLISYDHLLAGVNGVLNAVYLETDNLGPTLQTGAGAGKLPTASAVVGDVVDIARQLTAGKANPIPMGYYSRENEAKLISIDELVTKFYLRFTANDEPGVLASITSALSKKNISVESIIQKPVSEHDAATIIVVTHECREADVNAAVASLSGLETPQIIRFA